MIDWNRPVETRYGKPAEVLKVLENGQRAVLYKDPTDHYCTSIVSGDEDCNGYFRNKRKEGRITRWVNIYENEAGESIVGSFWETEEQANRNVFSNVGYRIACKRVTFVWTEGDKQ